MLTHDLKNLDLLIVKNLHRIRQIPFDVIVHLPRSGTIPASLLATYIKAPLASVDEFMRGIVNTRKSNYASLHRILLVDDSIRTGAQITKTIDMIKEARPDAEIFTLCIYSTKIPRRFQPTMVLSEHDETAYIYPWFMWKTKRIQRCAGDMDGVLCRDCEADEDDDGAAYLSFLETAELKFKTDFPIGAIVTSRLEKYRPQTMAWLQRHGIQYDKLIMGPWQTKLERKGQSAKWKAAQYMKTGAQLFIESNQKEAREIAAITGKPVWCIDTQEQY